MEGLLQRTPRPVKMWAKDGRLARRETATGASALAAARDLLDEVDNAPAQLGIVDTHEGLGKRQAVRGSQKIRHVSGRRRLAHALRPRHAGNNRRTIEEERHRNLENVRNLLQPARADAIGALFVFLHLLKSQAKSIAELFLTHRQHHATHAHAATDMLIDRIWRLLGHHLTRLLSISLCSAMAVDIKFVASNTGMVPASRMIFALRSCKNND